MSNKLQGSCKVSNCQRLVSDASNIARAVQQVPFTSLEHTHFTTTVHAYWTGAKLRHSLTSKLRSILGRNVQLDVSAMQQVFALIRYSFSSRPLYKNQYYYVQTPPLFGHPTPLLHHPHYCAIQCVRPTILILQCMPYNIGSGLIV